ncbi:transmembrane 220 family protein [uncultured Pontibacter sp.]|uniref:transmembrane 220 family protein n=1 Tax=uncultured Pontibacter sp. TaxID=453356 RepID=UPI002628EAB6|nr:transmembrane 220 family protein [uncultured Pontibacter sp.]
MAFKQVIAIALGVCLVVAAALQYSRPDAVLWIMVYLAGAIFSFMTALERMGRVWLLIAATAYTAGVYYFWQNAAASEVALLIFGAFSMLLLALLFKKKTSLHPPHEPGHIKRWAN